MELKYNCIKNPGYKIASVFTRNSKVMTTGAQIMSSRVFVFKIMPENMVRVGGNRPEQTIISQACKFLERRKVDRKISGSPETRQQPIEPSPRSRIGRPKAPPSRRSVH